MNKKLLNIFAGLLVFSWVFVISPKIAQASVNGFFHCVVDNFGVGERNCVAENITLSNIPVIGGIINAVSNIISPPSAPAPKPPTDADSTSTLRKDPLPPLDQDRSTTTTVIPVVTSPSTSPHPTVTPEPTPTPTPSVVPTLTPTPEPTPTSQPTPTPESKKTIKTIMVAGRFLKDIYGENPVTLDLTSSTVAPITITYSDGSEEYASLNFVPQNSGQNPSPDPTPSPSPTPTPAAEDERVTKIIISNYPDLRDNLPSDEGSSTKVIEENSLFKDIEIPWKLRTDRDQKYIYVQPVTSKGEVSNFGILGTDYGVRQHVGTIRKRLPSGEFDTAIAFYLKIADKDSSLPSPSPNLTGRGQITSINLDGNELINGTSVSFAIEGKRVLRLSIKNSWGERVENITLISNKKTPTRLCTPREYIRICTGKCVNGCGEASISQCNSSGTALEARQSECWYECDKYCGKTSTPTSEERERDGGKICTKGEYFVECTGNQAGCASDAGEAKIYQCNLAETVKEFKGSECNRKCAGSSSGSTPRSPTTPGDGTACTYPETCTREDGRGGVRTCNGTHQGGVCKYAGGQPEDICTTCQ